MTDQINLDLAALKLIYLALQNISQKWTMSVKGWKAALNRFAIVFGERLPQIYPRPFTQSNAQAPTS